LGQDDSRIIYDGLRTLLADSEALGEVRTINNADWNLEIGAITETVSELIPEPPALLFDEIKDYPKGLCLPLRFDTSVTSQISCAKFFPTS
jgi:3-polyprenyl-4-hydroxybenzoate decarboxylase